MMQCLSTPPGSLTHLAISPHHVVHCALVVHGFLHRLADGIAPSSSPVTSTAGCDAMRAPCRAADTTPGATSEAATNTQATHFVALDMSTLLFTTALTNRAAHDH